jgi:hypothetical protein
MSSGAARCDTESASSSCDGSIMRAGVVCRRRTDEMKGASSSLNCIFVVLGKKVMGRPKKKLINWVDAARKLQKAHRPIRSKQLPLFEDTSNQAATFLAFVEPEPTTPLDQRCRRVIKRRAHETEYLSLSNTSTTDHLL